MNPQTGFTLYNIPAQIWQGWFCLTAQWQVCFDFLFQFLFQLCYVDLTWAPDLRSVQATMASFNFLNVRKNMEPDQIFLTRADQNCDGFNIINQNFQQQMTRDGK
jgi:hypothetical protein